MRSRRSRLTALAMAGLLVLTACGDDDDGGEEGTGGGDTSGQEGGGSEGGGGGENTGTVNLMSAGEPEEVEAYQQIFDDLITSETDYEVEVESVGDFEEQFQIRAEGETLELAAVPQPGAIPALVDAGSIVSLEDLGFDIEELNNTLGESFVALGEYNGQHYGIPTNINLKSMVWYPKDDFDAAGYTVPTTFEELIALSDQMVADGNTPWCVGFESGGATGWPATDWMEDIMLRTAGPDVYDQWVAHEIPFNDPAILAAAEQMKTMWFTDGYVFGGNTRINATWVGDSQTPMFDAAGPKCWMHKQAAWIPDFWPKDAAGNAQFTPGEDSSFFYFPPIDAAHGSPVLGGGDMFVMFNDRPEVRALMQWFSTTDAVKDRVATGGFLAANNAVPADWYTSYPMSGLAEIAREATALRFDASDSMPKEVGAGTFWSGMVKWVSQNGEGTDQIFADIEASWP